VGGSLTRRRVRHCCYASESVRAIDCARMRAREVRAYHCAATGALERKDWDYSMMTAKKNERWSGVSDGDCAAKTGT